MITLLTYVGLGAILSFVGSIPMGTINVTTAHTAIREGFRAAISVALGAALVEFVQAALSLKFSGLIVDNPDIVESIKWASVVIFTVLGVYFLVRKDGTKGEQEPKTHTHARGFAKGVVVSALNVLAIPYWIFCGSYLAANDWIDLRDHTYIGLFAGGVFVGTFLLLIVYARLGVYAGQKTTFARHWSGLIVGIIFLGLATIQLIRVVA